VAEQPRRAALKRGQPGDRLRGEGSQVSSQDGEGIANLLAKRPFTVGAWRLDTDMRSARLQPEKRVGGDEGVAAEPGVIGGAVEVQHAREMSETLADAPGVMPRRHFLNQRTHRARIG